MAHHLKKKNSWLIINNEESGEESVTISTSNFHFELYFNKKT